MAITDNQFTASEFEEALKQNPELLAIIKGVATNNETVRGALEPEFIGPYTKRQAELIEADVLALTGIKKKDANEKYYDYWKRAVSESTEAAKGLKTELETLRSKGNPSQADRDRIAALENTLREKDEEFQTKISEKEKALSDLRIEKELQLPLAEFRAKYQKTIPESVIALVEKDSIEAAKKAARSQDDGSLVFIGEDGNPIIDKKNTYKPIPAKTYLEEHTRLKEIFDTGRQQGGAGTKGDDEQPKPAGGAAAFTAWPSDIKSKTQVTEHLLKLGIAQDSQDFAKIFDTLPADMPLR